MCSATSVSGHLPSVNAMTVHSAMMMTVKITATSKRRRSAVTGTARMQVASTAHTCVNRLVITATGLDIISGLSWIAGGD